MKSCKCHKLSSPVRFVFKVLSTDHHSQFLMSYLFSFTSMASNSVHWSNLHRTPNLKNGLNERNNLGNYTGIGVKNCKWIKWWLFYKGTHILWSMKLHSNQCRTLIRRAKWKLNCVAGVKAYRSKEVTFKC